jgi:hypothetical protein
MAPEFRRPLVVAELLGLQGDVVCLQEVDEKMFTHYLQPQMGEAGCKGQWREGGLRGRGRGVIFHLFLRQASPLLLNAVSKSRCIGWQQAAFGTGRGKRKSMAQD